MKMRTRVCAALAAIAIHSLALSAAAQQTKNVVIVMADGLRWQEVFRGADAENLNNPRYSKEDKDRIQKEFLAGMPEENRAALMPFVWTVIAKQGQLFGDKDSGSPVVVTNGLKFSYPGYNETLTGRPNPAIDSNNSPDNPNASVLEWLNNQKEFHGKVAAFAVWDRFAQILRRDKNDLLVNVAFDPLKLSPMPQGLAELNAIKVDLPKFDGEAEVLDAPQFYEALTYLRVKKPRVLFISLGETDMWAHEGEYPRYLEAVHSYDASLKVLWDTLQSMPEYRGQTTLVIQTDHGRGSKAEWTSHGRKIDGAEYIWTGYLGPDTQPLGLRTNTPQVTQGQLASTVAALLGKNFRATNKEIAPVLMDVIK